MPRRPAPTAAAAALDQLRALVERDGRSIAKIGRGLVPPMHREQLHQYLRGQHCPSPETLARIERGLRD